MRAMVYHGPANVRCETKPDPRIEHPEDIVLRVTATAICGSDLLGAVDRLLPEPGGIGSQTVHGHQATTRVTRSPIAVLMHRAARRNNEIVSPASTG